MPAVTRPLLSLMILFSLLLSGCVDTPENQLERVKQQGEIIMLTRNTASTFYEGPVGLTGLEYDLAKQFADHLGVKLKVVVANNVGELLGDLAARRGHFAAAGLTLTPHRQQRFDFSLPYQFIQQQVVYRSGSYRPRTVSNLQGLQLEVVANSSHSERLQQLQADYPNLRWEDNNDASSEELLILVNEQLIDYTIADSNEVKINRRFYPELRVAFNLTDPEPLAWAFPKDDDKSLLKSANKFFTQLKDSGKLDLILERHYGHIQQFDYVGTRIYRRHIKTRLPQFRPFFEKAGEQSEVDWILLAAMAYQESHWNPDAVSPTGVRGIMMITQATAEHIGIQDRTDWLQSIFGGAYYLSTLLERIPEEVVEPDRTLFAVASYNVGYWHVRDAMRLTQKRGGDPTKWKDLKKTLPLLRKRKFYSQLRHGYARGDEAVKYVENIRSYRDILNWQVNQELPPEEPPTKALSIEVPAL